MQNQKLDEVFNESVGQLREVDRVKFFTAVRHFFASLNGQSPYVFNEVSTKSHNSTGFVVGLDEACDATYASQPRPYLRGHSGALGALLIDTSENGVLLIEHEMRPHLSRVDDNNNPLDVPEPLWACSQEQGKYIADTSENFDVSKLVFIRNFVETYAPDHPFCKKLEGSQPKVIAA